MIRIPVVMTREAESWPHEELMYCSRANVWQEWGFTELGSGFAHCSSDSLATIDSKRQSTVERGISGERAGARFVYTIRDPGFRTNWLCPCQWGKEKRGEKAHEQKKRRENRAALAQVWIPTRHTSHVLAKNHCFSSSVVMLFFLSFTFLFLLLFLFYSFLFGCFVFFLHLVETDLKYWLKMKATGRHLDPCS